MNEGSGTLNSLFTEVNCCVIIPTYNNEKTLENVIQDSLIYTDKIIVVNDGATDSTPQILEKYTHLITLVKHEKNLGKGMALRSGFEKARELHYRYAITIDSDGQHFPSDFVHFLEKIQHHPDSIIIGSRDMTSENVPGGSSFGHKFSNFWFHFETGIKAPDTQSGFRLYPIKRLQKLKFYTTRFEFEIEVIVRSAWKGIPVLSVPIKIFYAKGNERVSHFRKKQDFARISYLNAYFVTMAILWYKPMRFFKGLSPSNIRSFLKKHFIAEEESVLKKSISISVGIFFGIVPIWGYQLVSAIAAAYLLKLNKALVILSANISIPPMIPFILLASIKTGEVFTGKPTHILFSDLSLETIRLNLYTYLVGACILSVAMALLFGLLTFVSLSLLRSRKKK